MEIREIESCKEDIINIASKMRHIKDMTLGDIGLMLTLHAEITGTKESIVDLKDISVEEYSDLINNMTNLFTVCTQYILDLDDYRDLRNLRTPSDLDEHLLHLIDILTETVNNEKDDLSTTMLENSRALGYFIWSCILSKDLRGYLIDPTLLDFEPVMSMIEEYEECDFLSNGYPMLKPLESRKILHEIFSKRKIQVIDQINERFKKSFIEETNNYDLTKEESILISELREYMLLKVTSRRGSCSDVEEFKQELIKMHEDKMIEIIKNFNELHNNTSIALQKANDEILSNLDLSEGIEFKNILTIYQDYLSEHIECLIDNILEIRHINECINRILVKFELTSSKVNSDKLALLRCNKTSKEIKYWIDTLLTEYQNTLLYYADYCQKEIIRRYKEYSEKSNVPEINLEQLLQTSEKRLNKTFKNIPSYRKLNKLAKQNGYTKIRDNGDHGIFRRYDGSTVVIPQGRSIGKGLSFKIQKDLEK